jgi:hypothetical protein
MLTPLASENNNISNKSGNIELIVKNAANLLRIKKGNPERAAK